MNTLIANILFFLLLCAKTTHKQECKLQLKEHQAKEASLLRNIRRVNKDVVNLGVGLNKTINALDLSKTEHAYNVNVAVKHAKFIERSHFFGVMKTEKDMGIKIQSEQIVSAPHKSSLCIKTFTHCLYVFCHHSFN